MKIFYGITKSNFGGAQRYVYDLAQATQQEGHNVSVILGGTGILRDKLEAKGIRVVVLENMGRDISPLFDIRSFFELFSILHREKPDVFHINSSKMGGIGGLAARLAGVKKIIFTSHGWAFNEKRSVLAKWVIKFLYWVTILLSHKTICVSEKTKHQVENWLLPPRRLVVIHNGTNPFDLVERQEAREKLVSGISPETFLVGTLGELHWIKGQDVLIEAWSKFAKDIDAKLVIAGTGELESSLKNLASHLNIADKVIFTGYIESARSLLSGLDLFVFPSRSENTPYALLEAGFAGLPVIASAVGGIPEIIRSNETGILVPKEDVGAIVSSLVDLKNNKEVRDMLGSNLKKFVLTNFSQEKMMRDTLKTYL